MSQLDDRSFEIQKLKKSAGQLKTGLKHFLSAYRKLKFYVLNVTTRKHEFKFFRMGTSDGAQGFLDPLHFEAKFAQKLVFSLLF